MKADNYAFLCKLIFEKAGIVLTDDKAYLMETRLTPVVRKYGLLDLDALAAALRSPVAPQLADFVDALTTNETFFFRDGKPFDEFRQHVLPQMIANRAAKKTLRIWSAASSTGQEAYSLAMILLEEHAKLAGWRIEVVGTDISHAVLARAQSGRYSQFEVQRGLPIQMLVKYFRKVDDQWEVNPQLKSMVQFREANLMREWTGLGQFDVVFCRNVLIYFDLEHKTSILDRISKSMATDGFLFLGGAETVLGISNRFEPVLNHRGVYQPVKNVAPAASARPAAGSARVSV
jgi:chemotaxis protein methyltransferase CheR